MYRPAVLYREMLAEWSPGRRNLVQDPFCRGIHLTYGGFDVYLKNLGKPIYCCITWNEVPELEASGKLKLSGMT